jgi:tetratricopeptide (TPR) repeat protein
LDRDPEKAASAFYWASRLDPSWAAPLYGQYAALLLAQPPTVLTGYLTRRDVALRNPALRRIDSLAYFALLKNPFVDRRFDGVILSTWLSRETNGQAELRDLGRYDRRFTAWAAYARGDFKMAASVYAEVIKRHPDDPDLQTWRALSFVAMGQNDSALTAVQTAIALEDSAESASLAAGWVSHAFAQYSVGYLFELGGQNDSARSAYERALLEDITFHPAHRQLARARLAAHDTAGALAEYVQAANLAPQDAGYLYDLGVLLMAAGRADSGATVLLQAATVEPFYALPHFPLGVAYERSGFDEEAADHFAAFLRLAPRSMAPAITAARERLAALTTTPPSP